MTNYLGSILYWLDLSIAWTCWLGFDLIFYADHTSQLTQLRKIDRSIPAPSHWCHCHRHCWFHDQES